MPAPQFNRKKGKTLEQVQTGEHAPCLFGSAHALRRVPWHAAATVKTPFHRSDAGYARFPRHSVAGSWCVTRSSNTWRGGA